MTARYHAVEFPEFRDLRRVPSVISSHSCARLFDEFLAHCASRHAKIALTVGDLDLVHGTVRISKARVAGVDKDTTKTGDDRTVTLCARALKIAKRQLLLRARMKAAGKIDHEFLFLIRRTD